MRTLSIRRLVNYSAMLLWLLVTASATTAQTKPETQQQSDQDDVIRVNTSLVQTDVMVFDKKGRFVDGLTAEQFALKIDNKPQTVAFFERVTSGSPREERRSQTTADTRAATTPETTTSAPVVRGRTVIFFIDDFHLAPASLVRTRKALLEFIDHGMRDNDQVAITSPSGQIGFLQQFTDNKIALRLAVARLNYRTNTKMDMDQPPMSEFIALKIRQGDESTISYYVSEMMKQNCFRPGGGEMICTCRRNRPDSWR